MNTLEYKNCKVEFRDCIEGMKELPDKSVDLCLTDPPYGIGLTQSRKTTKKGISFNDTKFLGDEWKKEALRVCKGVVFTPGVTNIQKYTYKYYPKIFFAWQGPITIYDIILADGKVPRWSYIAEVKQHIPCLYQGMVHPCPKPLDYWVYLLKKLQPTSVLDPFMGSGTTMEACLQLGIPCIGYELMEEYRVDMEKRIERSKYYKRPETLEKWFDVSSSDIQQKSTQ